MNISLEQQILRCTNFTNEEIAEILNNIQLIKNSTSLAKTCQYNMKATHLSATFIWALTPQGYLYWAKVNYKLTGFKRL